MINHKIFRFWVLIKQKQMTLFYALNSRNGIYIVICLLTLILFLQLRNEIQQTNFHYFNNNDDGEIEREQRMRKIIPKARLFEKTFEDDQHIKMISPINTRIVQQKRTKYPNRLNMGKCPKIFGNIFIFVAVVESSYKTLFFFFYDLIFCFLDIIVLLNNHWNVI